MTHMVGTKICGTHDRSHIESHDHIFNIYMTHMVGTKICGTHDRSHIECHDHTFNVYVHGIYLCFWNYIWSLLHTHACL